MKILLEYFWKNIRESQRNSELLKNLFLNSLQVNQIIFLSHEDHKSLSNDW